ncbi:hypothetical protein RclHR1_13220004 [Rhizophagus clarus]|uniref:Uncharacterized protein n=1 Tax=Rhizophagus clarus TaxID=94130 RepID=A0A2Z6Q9J4_9GLOM|nr:hypothetical protein RclHR1_13220004 [Rhizophagus clarus]GES83936.1 hypothetical protein RCL_jg19478.t1 [Rhizophagus clarus]
MKLKLSAEELLVLNHSHQKKGSRGLSQGVTEKISKNRQENLQPIYNIQIPSSHIITLFHSSQTPEHQIFSLSSIVSSIISPITRSESDEETDNDFDADN